MQDSTSNPHHPHPAHGPRAGQQADPRTLVAELLAHVAMPSIGHTLPQPLPHEPFTLLRRWFDEEVQAGRTPNPNAINVACIDADGTPSNRIVLCRGMDSVRGTITFFTNYQSRKGRALMANPRASACFHWDHSDRQARLEGSVAPCSANDSDAYFASRRWESRLAAWISQQSQPIASREDLLGRLPEVMERLGLSAQDLIARGNDVAIPRPPHWGGFTLTAHRVELWLGGPGRLHDRAEWVRRADNSWSCTRVQP